MSQVMGRASAFVGSAVLLWMLSAPVAAEDTGTIEEIVAILRDEGLIDEATQQKLLVKHASEQKKKTSGVLGGLEWNGDLRMRHEAFWYDGDATGTPEPDNRYRFRYRARIGFQKQLGDRIRVGMRLASGVGSNRGTNTSFGEQPDFRPDDIFIDRAWVELRLGDGPVNTRLVLGKVANPFLWRVGLDRLMWDPDVTPEGGYVQARRSFGERAELWATLGAFIVKENSGAIGSKSDPKVFALQLGASRSITDALEIGGRVTGYEWRSLDRPFIDRAKLFGNLESGFDSKARIGELSAYARFTAAERLARAAPRQPRAQLHGGLGADRRRANGCRGHRLGSGVRDRRRHKERQARLHALSRGGERDRRQLRGQRPARRPDQPRGLRRVCLAEARPACGATTDVLRSRGDPELESLRGIAARWGPSAPAVGSARELLSSPRRAQAARR